MHYLVAAVLAACAVAEPAAASLPRGADVLRVQYYGPTPRFHGYNIYRRHAPGYRGDAPSSFYHQPMFRPYRREYVPPWQRRPEGPRIDLGPYPNHCINSHGFVC